MFITIDERDARPIYQQVVDGIKELVARGELQEGSALPPVRQVAADHRCGDTGDHCGSRARA